MLANQFVQPVTIKTRLIEWLPTPPVRQRQLRRAADVLGGYLLPTGVCR